MRLARFLAVSICLLVGGALVASGSADTNPYREYADLITVVHDASMPDFRTSGSRCATCHGNVFSQTYILLKSNSSNGEIVEELKKNHHRLHEKNEAAAFGNDCTFCHAQFDVTQDATGNVLVSSYVDKLSCAACHSSFTPTQRMDESYIGDGCPGCHGDKEDWWPWHLDPVYAPDIVRRFVDTVNITLGTEYCLDCHGFNKYIMTPEDQALWWAMDFEERNAYTANRGAPWSWTPPE